MKTSRYSHCEAHLAELITHAALSEQHRENPATGAETVAVSVREKRRRLETALAAARSPLNSVEERSRNDPDWAAVHHRQAWFLQVIKKKCAFTTNVVKHLGMVLIAKPRFCRYTYDLPVVFFNLNK